MRPGEDESVIRIASEAFDGYIGHYHADERLNPDSCTEAYIFWAQRLCTGRTAQDDVLVAELDNQLVGFGAMRLNTPEEGEGVLFGVAPAAQRRGVYRSLMLGSLRWCLARGARAMLYSTQIANMSAQRTVTRLGFEAQRAYYTFHRWFPA
jgi:GNAT superfamily N-acetyltransferase